MSNYVLDIISVTPVTHDVIQINTPKPHGLSFQPGQAADISINKKGWVREKRSFTFTSLPDDDFLQFIIKTYPEHKGVTNQLRSIKPGDQLIIHDIFGSIQYKGEGLFIAGGAGVTPFISIFRNLRTTDAIGKNKLLFANKTEDDIILLSEFSQLLKGNFINILSEGRTESYPSGFITEDFLSKFFDEYTQYFYLCGPPPMMKAVEGHMEKLGIAKEKIVKEAF